MKFMNEDFLLETPVARKLYHDFAENQPIIDYHCHISPKEVYEDRKFDNITQVWLGGDHYKWRMIRTNGVPEEEVTGSASDRIKFQRFAQALPLAIGNPMYHWTHLELKRYFGVDTPLTGDTAEEIWKICNEKLATPELSVRNIIKSSNVKMIGTTDDPADDLAFHKLIAEDQSFGTKVLPSFRPDTVVNIEKPVFPDAVAKLAKVCGFAINNPEDLKKALTQRLDYFCAHGCKASDHGMDAVVYRRGTADQVRTAFEKAMERKPLTVEEIEIFRTEMLLHLGRENAKRGVVMQIHYGVQRNTNTKKFQTIGADTGFDTIAGGGDGIGLARFLDALAQDDALPKTIIYSLDPKDNELIDTIIGSFQGPECPGKIQHGSAWWFSDTKSGMENQLKSLANLSILGNFVGMLTDSRSFLSYTRHEYFRRILCNFLGKLVDNGEYPEDYKMLEKIVSGISYENAKRYFEL
ncbi:MAG: glucuronate isomerase [Ruminococcaceae bacterium]|nr:glucuronate isomerase [Oscillospiraceae bacterium]